MSAIEPIADGAIRRARKNLLESLEAGRLHLHLRTNSRQGLSLAAWWVTFHKTALCRTDRCVWVVKKARTE